MSQSSFLIFLKFSICSFLQIIVRDSSGCRPFKNKNILSEKLAGDNSSTYDATSVIMG